MLGFRLKCFFPMASNNNGLPMPFLAVLDGLFADLHPLNFAVVTRAFSGEHVLLVVCRRASRDVGAADVADRSLDALVDGGRFDPCSSVDDPDSLGVLDPGLLGVARAIFLRFSGVFRRD